MSNYFGLHNSILHNTKEVAYEIIIADDHSSDLTKTIEERVMGIGVVRHKRNMGFLQNYNNSAARQAKGSFLVFLNNDTSVKWLANFRNARDAEKDSSKVGMVGPQLLFADGRLQEMEVLSGRMGRDGTMDEESPKLYQFNYRKEVDYISGCLFVIKEKLVGYRRWI